MAKHKSQNGDFMILCLRIAGYGLCILPALFSSLEHFPLWFSEKETALSILGLLLLALVALPLWKTVKQALKSPSAWVVWFLLWLF